MFSVGCLVHRTLTEWFLVAEHFLNAWNSIYSTEIIFWIKPLNTSRLYIFLRWMAGWDRWWKKTLNHFFVDMKFLNKKMLQIPWPPVNNDERPTISSQVLRFVELMFLEKITICLKSRNATWINCLQYFGIFNDLLCTSIYNAPQQGFKSGK